MPAQELVRYLWDLLAEKLLVKIWNISAILVGLAAKCEEAIFLIGIIEGKGFIE